MARYHGRHEAPATRTSGRRPVAPTVLATVGAVGLVTGVVGYASARDLGPPQAAAAPVLALSAQDQLQALAHHADTADLLDQRTTAGRASHLLASSSADAAPAQAATQAAQAAAAAAQLQAQRQAEAERAARDAQRQAVVDNAKQDPRAAARAMLGDFGFADSQFSCLSSLWTKESNWTSSATNRSSGAYGIPQSLPGSKMASAGADWRTNPVTQIRWGLQYIKSVYGSPCAAWGHSQQTNWY